MTDVLEGKKAKAKELEEGNARSYKELCEAAGRDLGIDTSDMRRELFFDYLVTIGIMTAEQQVDFDILFLEKVEEKLNEFWEKWRESKGPKLSVVKKPEKKLLGPNGRPL